MTYQNYYIPSDSVEIPAAYIIKRGWHKVKELLELNRVRFAVLEKDSVLEVESYKIKSYQTSERPYEGHYPHYNTDVSMETRKMTFVKGDLVVLTDQPGIRYIMETLEPEATDSFFNWNFFDTILQQKEEFSPYVFEDFAAEMLKNDARLKAAFEEKKKVDSLFSNNWYSQLDWLFNKSKFYEPAHLQYPIYRVAHQAK